ncbi:xanthine dehydrogenase family protein molybdopterin-binding subunit [Spirosoma sp. KNUC1025]|uniref:xanthine dehydrogenase family protein molybdopterin-binding subunit n=1 Tax=Spirosoma sp. KNUC1025 TaxID=2894082 RepID=UPI00386F510A|nr:xanthine dehydrogenase family protein molybdopterin-binding subunit [Spirosoma sp. KNUC1025]
MSRINNTMTNNDRVNRRSFLKASAVGAGGLLIGFSLPAHAAERLASLPATETPLNAYLRIGTDNQIHMVLSKVEMGQGIWTTIPMLIAEELDCDWNSIRVEHSPPGIAADFSQSLIARSTGGSETTVSEFDRCRLAGATARQMLVNAAAKRLGVSPESCRTENSFVIAGEHRLSYSTLAADASTLPVPTVTLRGPNQWKYIGKSQKRLDAPDKINGKAIYGLDIYFPGLLTAVVAHAPVFGGTVKSFDTTKASAVKGVRLVVQIPTGVAVIADSFWAAKVGREALTIDWHLGPNATLESAQQLATYRQLANSTGLSVHQKGNVTAGLQNANRVIDAEYSFPYLAHAPMEPLNCTVKIGADQCEVWVGTQSPLLHQAEIATSLGLKPEQVLLHTPMIGGSFGRRGTFSQDWVMEAVQIAKISGKAIKLVWSREDDIQGGYYRPVYVHRVKVGTNPAGVPIAWQHRIVGQSLFVNTPLQDLIAPKGVDYSSVTRGAPYSEAIPDCSFELHTTKVGVPVSAWRSVGATHTAFVMETLIDELATQAAVDPVAYRRALLKKAPHHLAALNLAAYKAGWTKPLPAGQFRGIAVCEAMSSYVAQVVEVSVADKQIRVHRVVCAIDCGLPVNPDGVVAQMEGCIIFGLTAALYGEITLANGQVQQSNFHDYRILRMNEAPTIEVHIVPSTERMGGAGEPGVAPVAPALANALFAATGKRFRHLPLRLSDSSKS